MKRNKKNSRGRPPLITKEVLAKLEQAFALGASDNEACLYADINPVTLYRYQEKHPEYCKRKELLKEKPILLARGSVVKSFQLNPELAFKYLERKCRKEFGPKHEIEGKFEVKHETSVIDEILGILENAIPGEDQKTPTEGKLVSKPT